MFEYEIDPSFSFNANTLDQRGLTWALYNDQLFGLVNWFKQFFMDSRNNGQEINKLSDL